MSLRRTAQPLHTSFPIVFGRWFSKVAIGFVPTLAELHDVGVADPPARPQHAEGLAVDLQGCSVRKGSWKPQTIAFSL